MRGSTNRITRKQQWTAGHYALPSPSLPCRIMRLRGVMLVLLGLMLLSGCGAKPKPPTAPIRTHIEEAIVLLPRVPATVPWRQFAFNDWERLRARVALGDIPATEWTKDPHARGVAMLDGWLVPPSTVAAGAALGPLGVDAATIRWQASLDGPGAQPITRLVTAPARDDRPKTTGASLSPLGFTTSPPQATGPVVYQRGANAAGTLPALLDPNAAALVVTPATLVSTHDAAHAPDVLAAFGSESVSLDADPFFHGLIAGISDVEALVVYRAGSDGYRDATAPALDAAYLPFDAVGAALHITDAGARYATLAFHLPALPGGRLPEGMAEWWATRFGLDQPDPRVEYLEAFGNDGWLFARYRILSPDEQLGGVPPGEVPFWKHVTTWQSVHQRWMNFAPRNADPVPRLGS